MSIQLSDHFTYKKLLRFIFPSIATMIVTSIYTIVDGFFVSNYAGKTPFAALNLIYPVIMIMGALGFMFSSGGTALVSYTLGKGNKDKADSYFSLIIYTGIITGLILSIIGFIFTPDIAILLGAGGELLHYAIIYSRIILLGLPFFMLQIMFQSFFVAAAKPHLGLNITILSGITNMVLDAIVVPNMPLEYRLHAAAFATIFAQIVGGLIPLIYFFSKNKSTLKLGKTKFELRPLIKSCTNGLSEFMTNISMSVVGMLYNFQLMKFAGENGIAAYGVMMYVSMIFASAFIGYSMGASPIISYHYGAKNYNELKNLFKKSLILITIFGVGMTISAEVLAKPLSLLYVGYDAELLKITTDGFYIFGLSFLFMGFGIFTSGFFTALNDGITSATVSFLRTFIFQVVSVLLLPVYFHLTGVWMSLVSAELLAVFVSAFFLIKYRKKFQY
ncbi:MAG: MATE family efflux transporter [Erysipelotrichaceae bacterium]|nr:MATE family efflux transporter [Erysipelotrichaceae bacterium]